MSPSIPSEGYVVQPDYAFHVFFTGDRYIYGEMLVSSTVDETREMPSLPVV